MKNSSRISSYRRTNKTRTGSRKGHALTPAQRKRFSKKSGGLLKGKGFFG